jgi:plasmid rolling circle replication initiator protein Rep
MYYVYLDSPYGTELIGKSTDKSTAEKIKSEQDSKWEVGFMWTTRITENEEKENSYYD